MRRIAKIGVALAGVALAIYSLLLGVYAVASTRPGVATEPTTPEEARAVIAELGLAAEYPFQNGFAQTPHGRMHYAEAGQGAPVLCLHGNATWSFAYRQFLRELSRGRRVIAPDLVGFGLSEKPAHPADYSIAGHIDDVSALVESLDLRDMTLVVQDWGGPIGLGVALRAPERVRALVVLNTFALSDGGVQPAPFDQRVARIPVVGEQLVQGLGLIHSVELERGIAHPERRTQQVLHAYRDVQGGWYERAGALAFPRLIPTESDDPTAALLRRSEEFLAHFQGPVLILWGLRDPVYGRDILEGWRRRVPRASVVELPAAGHFVQEDDPAALLRELSAFLTQVYG